MITMHQTALLHNHSRYCHTSLSSILAVRVAIVSIETMSSINRVLLSLSLLCSCLYQHSLVSCYIFILYGVCCVFFLPLSLFEYLNQIVFGRIKSSYSLSNINNSWFKASIILSMFVILISNSSCLFSSSIILFDM